MLSLRPLVEFQTRPVANGSVIDICGIERR